MTGTPDLMNYPVIFSVFSMAVLWLAAQFGASLRKRRPLKDERVKISGWSRRLP